jgi:hypothetical protein
VYTAVANEIKLAQNTKNRSKPRKNETTTLEANTTKSLNFETHKPYQVKGTCNYKCMTQPTERQEHLFPE